MRRNCGHRWVIAVAGKGHGAAQDSGFRVLGVAVIECQEMVGREGEGMPEVSS